MPRSPSLINAQKKHRESHKIIHCTMNRKKYPDLINFLSIGSIAKQINLLYSFYQRHKDEFTSKENIEKIDCHILIVYPSN